MELLGQIVDQQWMRFLSESEWNKHRLEKLPSRPGYQRQFIQPQLIYAEIRRITAEIFERTKADMEKELASDVVGLAFQFAKKAPTEDEMAEAQAEAADQPDRIPLGERLKLIALKIIPSSVAISANVALAFLLCFKRYNLNITM